MHKDWMQIGVAVYVAGMLGYLIVTKGDEKFIMLFSGIFATKIVDFAYKAITKKD
jgi:hypothetical protein